MLARRALLRPLLVPVLIAVAAFAPVAVGHAEAAGTANPHTAAGAKRESSGLLNVELRSVKLPAAPTHSKLSNPVDLLLAAHLKGQGVDLARTVTDRVFARRVFLDLIGLLPSPEELDAFVRDSAVDKRAALVRRLLAQREDYGIHWLAFWNDLLRNEYRGTGFIDDGRRQITAWLFRSLYENRPYNQFVHELISPVKGSEGFVKGIEWRGVVNASQRRELQAAQTTAQVFLGTNLKCASCHDSFTNQWLLSDSHGLAAVFADGPLDIYRCDKATGEQARASFLFPEIGAIDADAPRSTRMRQLADLITDPHDGRLAKTVVNRYWARLFGRGLVEPLDDMERNAWNPDLLDWLANDLVQHGYDLKHTLELICTSQTYQLAARGEPKPNEPAGTFRGPISRRMTAEQFLDAVATLTGVWPSAGGDMLKVDGRGQGGQVGAVRQVLSEQESKRAAEVAKKVRAALLMDGALSRALGRPNREQVVTRRDTLATMLQALEMTNGTTLDAILKTGSERWIAEHGSDSKALIARAYRISLGREPTPAETQTASDVVGTPPTAEGVDDFLWMLVMLPEFQLID
ncbi:MAG TPA: DUF1549 and DUF1553 domain-containing protein [Planctomycetaceae bacterium]|jgi:hypothetical protein|nr:DUF1549 and DUF1553 domain-containing protein [Planctomycetaceae bacterium]